MVASYFKTNPILYKSLPEKLLSFVNNSRNFVTDCSTHLKTKIESTQAVRNNTYMIV